MEPEGPLPHSQVPAICLCPEPQQSSPCPPYLDSWRSNLILSSHLRLDPPSDLLPLGLSTKPCMHLSCLPHTLRATCPTHLIRLDLTTRIIFGEQYRSLSSSLYNFLYSPVTPSFLDPNILLSILFSNTLSLRSSLNVSDQVSNPYKTAGKITVLYILIFIFLDSTLKTGGSAPNGSSKPAVDFLINGTTIC